MSAARKKCFVILLMYQFGDIFIECLRINLDRTLTTGLEKKEILEGEELEIVCNEKFADPIGPEEYINYESWNNRFFSPYKRFRFDKDSYESKSNGFDSILGTAVLKKNKTRYGDTGKYECVYRNDEKTSVYVFVKSQKHYFAEDFYYPVPKFAVNKKFEELGLSNEVVISCEPTSLSYDLYFYKNDTLLNSTSDRSDLKTDYISTKDPGIYSCELKNKGETIAIKEFNVTEIYEDPELYITGGKCAYFNGKEPLRINCTASYSHDIRSGNQGKPSLHWTYSNGKNFKFRGPIESGVQYHPISHPVIANYRLVSTELTIFNISVDETRDLICTVIYSNHSEILYEKSVPIHVVVIQPDFEGLVLSTNFSNKTQQFVGGEAQFVVSIKAYPEQPHITWFDSKGRKIFADGEKFLIENTCEQTKLKILNLELQDEGNYRVDATTSHPKYEKTIIFALNIRLVR